MDAVTVEPSQLVVLFDGVCGLCRQLRELLATLDVRRRIAWVPLQTPGVLEAVGLGMEQVTETVWAIAPDGRRLSGAEVCAAIFDRLSPLPALCERALRIRMLKLMAERGFKRVSESRSKLACNLEGWRRFEPLDENAERELQRRVRVSDCDFAST